MTDEDRPTFASLMAMLAETFGEAVSAARAEGYWLALQDLAVDAVQQAVASSLRVCRFFPRPRELRDLAGAGLPDVGVVDALVLDWLWGRRVPARDFVRLVVSRMGGRRAVEDMPAGVRFAHVREVLPGVLAAARSRHVELPPIDYAPQVARVDAEERLGIEGPESEAQA